MFYLTGDTHRDFDRLEEFLYYADGADEDVLIILGDVGINYHGHIADYALKQELNELPITLFCIYGNHEIRPENIDSYEITEWNGGRAFWEPEFPNLIFAIDGEIYDLDGLRCIVIGGANSIDKHMRTPGVDWWEDEQPSDDIMRRVEDRLEAENWKIDVVFSHTCPYKYLPYLVYIPPVQNQSSSIDNTTELWLDKIEDKLTYSRWYCGHFHTDAIIDKVYIMYQGFRELT